MVLRSQARGEHAPGFFKNETTITQFQTRHLINMTGHLCKDATYKLRMADLIQTEYKNTHGYELGLVAAGIMEKFKHMIRIYRYYSDPKSFKDHNSTIQQIMGGYSIIQGDYNEMVAETVLFYQILGEHSERDNENRVKAKAYAKKHRMKLSTVLNLMQQGVKLEGLNRRSMQTELERDYFKKLIARGPDEQELKKKTGIIWGKKNVSNQEEDEYKKKLRYIMWADKWNGFNPAIEGVHIPDSVARVGLANASDFLERELKGDI